MRHRPMGSFGRCRVAAIVAALAFTTMVNAQNVSQPNAGDRPPAPLLPAGKVIFDAAVARTKARMASAHPLRFHCPRADSLTACAAR